MQIARKGGIVYIINIEFEAKNKHTLLVYENQRLHEIY